MEIKFSVMAIFIPKGEEVRMLKIKKVDDKPMVIHTKGKTKIHYVESKELSTKARNILAREVTPKMNGATGNTEQIRTVNQKQVMQKTKDSIKKKGSNLKYAGLAGVKT